MTQNKIQKQIVQGDTYRTKIILKNINGQEIDHTTIERIYVTSSKLGINKYITYDTDGFYLEFSSNETQAFHAGRYSFDITVHFYGDDGTQVKTVSYKSTFVILRKENPIIPL